MSCKEHLENLRQKLESDIYKIDAQTLDHEVELETLKRTKEYLKDYLESVNYSLESEAENE